METANQVDPAPSGKQGANKGQTIAKFVILFCILFACALLLVYRLNHLPEKPAVPLPAGHPHKALVIEGLGSLKPGTEIKYRYMTISPVLFEPSPVDRLEVDLSTGKLVLRQTEAAPAAMPPFERVYNSFDTGSRCFGLSTTCSYDIAPVGSRNPYTFIDLILADGDSLHFDRVSRGTGCDDAVYLEKAPAGIGFDGATIRWNGNGWNLDQKSGERLIFPESYFAKNRSQGALTAIAGGGQSLTVTRSHLGSIEKIASQSGEQIAIENDERGRISVIRDDQGTEREFFYDNAGHLVETRDHKKPLFHFAYDRDGLLSEISSGVGLRLIAIQYHGGRVSELDLADGRSLGFQYQLSPQDTVISTKVREFVTYRKGRHVPFPAARTR